MAARAFSTSASATVSQFLVLYDLIPILRRQSNDIQIVLNGAFPVLFLDLRALC